jgi:hypothetical protein
MSLALMLTRQPSKKGKQPKLLAQMHLTKRGLET